ncbi:nematode fatty acid retinoid binding protein [Ancylostoma ceylanicum]|uniref:Fatty-acid and retinol-binding protein 1 n=1 Tax=Ancylostoma ceylanicum TaxID=53326 RepID=A0A0D6M976_9BILA|nr:nematode fatty acid retinoid binding protein [Ancylostoma ceylanicum]
MLESLELMPERVKSLIVGLSSQEQATMKEVYENLHTYKNDQEVVAAIRAKSPGLASKLEQFQSWWSEKAAGLGPEARAYFDAMHENAYKIRARFYAGKRPSNAEIKQAALETITKYKALSAAAKADFQKQFPLLTRMLSNDETYKAIQSLN